jgi:hypothetical protein
MTDLFFLLGLSLESYLCLYFRHKSPSAASNANSIIRYLLTTSGLSLVQIFIDAMGVGWTFTLFEGLCMGCLGVAWMEMIFGRYGDRR